MDQKKLVGFLSFWVVNSVVVIVASVIFRNNIVLGNATLSMPLAAVFSGLVITALGYIVIPIVEKTNIKNSLKALKLNSDAFWGSIFLIFNIVIVWILKRFALALGLGVSSLIYTVILAVILTVAQWAVYKTSGKSMKT